MCTTHRAVFLRGVPRPGRQGVYLRLLVISNAEQTNWFLGAAPVRGPRAA